MQASICSSTLTLTGEVKEMSEWNKPSCDVLIIGGGIGGLSCATAIKEHNPDADVLVVEKNFAGYAGKANRGGGVLQYFDLEKDQSQGFRRLPYREHRRLVHRPGAHGEVRLHEHLHAG